MFTKRFDYFLFVQLHFCISAHEGLELERAWAQAQTWHMYKELARHLGSYFSENLDVQVFFLVKLVERGSSKAQTYQDLIKFNNAPGPGLSLVNITHEGSGR